MWEWIYLFELMFSFSLDKYPEVELLDHISGSVFKFWRNSILFMVAAPVYIPISSVQGFLNISPHWAFLYIFTNTCYFLSFW